MQIEDDVKSDHNFGLLAEPSQKYSFLKIDSKKNSLLPSGVMSEVAHDSGAKSPALFFKGESSFSKEEITL